MMFPKTKYLRDKKRLEACRTLPCQHCGAEDGTVVAAHSNQSIHGKAKSLKASDEFVAALCQKCHYEVDQGKGTNYPYPRRFTDDISFKFSFRRPVGIALQTRVQAALTALNAN